MTEINDGVTTIEDIDKSGTTCSVAPDAPAGGLPSAAESAPAASEAAQTEAKGEAAPGTEQAKPEGDEPEWFKKRLKDISRDVS